MESLGVICDVGHLILEQLGVAQAAGVAHDATNALTHNAVISAGKDAVTELDALLNHHRRGGVCAVAAQHAVELRHESLQMQQGIAVFLHGGGAVQCQKGVDVAGVAGEEQPVLAVQQNDTSDGVTGDMDDFQLHAAAQIKDVAVVDRPGLYGAGRDNVGDVRRGQTGDAAVGLLLGKTPTALDAGMVVGVHQGNVIGMDVALAVLKDRADVVQMAVGDDDLHGQLGQIPDKGLQRSDAGETVDQQGALGALHQIGDLAAVAADGGDIVRHFPGDKEFAFHV